MSDAPRPTAAAEPLRAYGWNARCEEAAIVYRERGLDFGRVTVENRETYVLITGGGERSAEVSGRFQFAAGSPSDFPKVGDWVAIMDYPAEAKAVIHEVLPRAARLSRRAVGRRTEEQVLAANIDVIILVQGLDFDFNLRRLERQMVMIRESGAAPVVLLNKADLLPDAGEAAARAREALPGVDVLAVSALHEAGLDDLRARLHPAETHILIGSSGAGKSTLINKLLGRDRQAVAPVRTTDSHGRHTTSRRELIVLPGGALLIDTPGVREFQLWDTEDGVDEVFADIAALADECRFGDCTHLRETGCAVLAAVEAGTLPAGRYQSWLKLRKEQAFLETKRREKPGADKQAWSKAIHKSMKSLRKLDPKARFRD